MSPENSIFWQDYHISTARKMSDTTPDLLLLIQQTLCIVQYQYSSLSKVSRLVR